MLERDAREREMLERELRKGANIEDIVEVMMKIFFRTSLE